MPPSTSPRDLREVPQGRDRIERNPGPEVELARALVQSRGLNRLLRTALPDLLGLWAGGSRLKQILAKPVAGYLVRSLTTAAKTPGEPDPLADLFSDPAYVQSLAERLPALLASLSGGASALSESVGRIPAPLRADLARKAVASLPLGDAARVLNAAALQVSEAHEQDPTLFAEAVRPRFREFIAGLDFGQLKETLARAEQDAAAVSAMAGEELWQYPAKLVCLLSLLPSLANIGIRSLTGALAPTRELPPDLLADVAASFLREVSGPRLGELFNELSELVRRVHTGSVLIGDPGCPRLPKDLEDLAAGVLTSLDVPVLLKAAAHLDDLKRACAGALAAALRQDPRLARASFLRPFQAAERRSRTWSERVGAWESLFNDEELAALVSDGMALVSGEELAETVNRLCSLLNRAVARGPRSGASFLSRFISALDPEEVGQTARRFAADLAEQLKPMAPEIVPPLLRGAAALIAAAEQGGGSELREAVSALRSSLDAEEAFQ